MPEAVVDIKSAAAVKCTDDIGHQFKCMADRENGQAGIFRGKGKNGHCRIGVAGHVPVRQNHTAAKRRSTGSEVECRGRIRKQLRKNLPVQFPDLLQEHMNLINVYLRIMLLDHLCLTAAAVIKQ